jgi:hypothetical protein
MDMPEYLHAQGMPVMANRMLTRPTVCSGRCDGMAAGSGPIFGPDLA